TYQVNGKVVSIRPAVKQPLTNNQMTIRGRVTDSIGKPLEGVIVELEGTSLQTATDKQGFYVIDEVLVGGNLLFRLIGHEVVKTPANRPEINIILYQLVSQLNEVLVERGYYQVSKRLNTGSVSTITAKEIASQPVNDPIIALQGRIPGMYI